MFGQGDLLFLCFCIPEVQDLIGARGGEHRVIRTESHGQHMAAMPLEPGQLFPRRSFRTGDYLKIFASLSAPALASILPS